MKTFLTIMGLVAVIGVIILIKVLQISTLIHTKAVIPPEPVSSIQVAEQTWQRSLTSVGSVSPVQGVTVPAELDGKIVEIDFEAGSTVKAGDVLVRQDTSAEEAQLRSAEANAELAHVNLERTRELLAKATVSQAQFDADTATYKQAVAAADNIRATIAKKTVKAPFAGQLGIRLVNLGQSLKAGDPIVSLQSLGKLFVDFYLPQEQVRNVKAGLKVAIEADAIQGKSVEGVVTAVNTEVDAATRNVRVQATVDNESGLLRPGMYVDVAVELPQSDAVLTVPATAIVYAPYGDTVYVIEEKKGDDGTKQLVVRQQNVRLGARKGDFVVVASGLKVGETVVTSGVFRLRPGGAVMINNALAPDAQLAPKPANS